MTTTWSCWKRQAIIHTSHQDWSQKPAPETTTGYRDRGTSCHKARATVVWQGLHQWHQQIILRLLRRAFSGVDGAAVGAPSALLPRSTPPSCGLRVAVCAHAAQPTSRAVHDTYLRGPPPGLATSVLPSTPMATCGHAHVGHYRHRTKAEARSLALSCSLGGSGGCWRLPEFSSSGPMPLPQTGKRSQALGESVLTRSSAHACNVACQGCAHRQGYACL